mmetsp:Transcript_15099/g.25801  ORF Transcript_15099/g.25801 Transcript_15099/m.25801 type:complete len:222 (-) Transcript_15099:2328-2993(-)
MSSSSSSITLTRRPLLSLVTLLDGSSDDFEDSGLSGSGAGLASKSFLRFAIAANLPPLMAVGDGGFGAAFPASLSSFFSSLTLGSVVDFSFKPAALTATSALTFAFSSESVDIFFSSPSADFLLAATSFDTNGTVEFATSEPSFLSPPTVESFWGESFFAVESFAELAAAPAPDPFSFLDSPDTATFWSFFSSSLMAFKLRPCFTTIPCFSLYSATSFGTT